MIGGAGDGGSDAGSGRKSKQEGVVGVDLGPERMGVWGKQWMMR